MSHDHHRYCEEHRPGEAEDDHRGHHPDDHESAGPVLHESLSDLDGITWVCDEQKEPQQTSDPHDVDHVPANTFDVAV